MAGTGETADVPEGEERWDSKTAEAYDIYNISDHPVVWDALVQDLLPFSRGKVVVDLGCADGKLGAQLEAESVANVDPYPPENAPRPIIKQDGADYLKSRADESIDLVVSAFAVHFMDREKLDAEVARVLKPGGRAIYFSFSRTSPWFGNETFNTTFVSVGFERDGASGEVGPKRSLEVLRPMTHEQMTGFVENRTWSNLRAMSDEQIKLLSSLVPKDLEKVSLLVDVFEFIH